VQGIDLIHRAELRKAEAGSETAPQNIAEEGDILINGELNKLKRASLTAMAASVFTRHQRLRMDSLERGGSETHSYTLLDLFWTIYSKFRAVLEGQRVVSEVVSRIAMVSLSRQCPFEWRLTTANLGTDEFV